VTERLNKYDVLITDITDTTKVFGIDYLTEATENDVKKEVGAINGYYASEPRALDDFNLDKYRHGHQCLPATQIYQVK
jgi:hypothetical protein